MVLFLVLIIARRNNVTIVILNMFISAHIYSFRFISFRFVSKNKGCFSLCQRFRKFLSEFKWNWKVRFGFLWPEYSGSPLVVHTFRSEYSDRNSPFHFGQTGSLPLSGNSVTKFKMIRAISVLVGPVKSVNVLPFFSGILTDLWPVSLASCKAPTVNPIQTSWYCRAELKWIWRGSGMTKERQWFQKSKLIQSCRWSEEVLQAMISVWHGKSYSSRRADLL